MSYERLLQEFWDGHDPRPRRSTQYASMIFTHGKAQAAAAQASYATWVAENGGVRPATGIREAGVFYSGEYYHHK